MTRDLSIGSRGDDVAELQMQLKQMGYYSGDVDGVFGEMTDAAVKAFQEANSMYVDGIVGPVTRGVLEGKKEPETPPDEVIKAARIALQAGNGTIESARWAEHRFIISSDVIRSFDDLQITGSSEVEKSDEDDQGFYYYKGSNPTEVTMTVKLNAFAGCDVRSEIESFVMDAKRGTEDYIYVGYKKLFDCMMILTNAVAKKIEFSPSMDMLSADVTLTFKQGSSDGLGGKKTTKSSKSDSDSSNSSGSSSGGGGDYSGGGGGGGYSGGGYDGGSDWTDSGSQKDSLKKSGRKLTDEEIKSGVKSGTSATGGLKYQNDKVNAAKTKTVSTTSSHRRMTGAQE